MIRVLVLAAVVLASAITADAAPRKYHFKLADVTAKQEVTPEFAKEATPRVDAIVRKTFQSHAQLVAELDGAPDPLAKPDAYRKYLAKKRIAGAYLVTVEITEASIELVPMESKANSQRLVVRIAIHLLGETIPGRTMGFTGDGQATIKLEIGKKVRARDREYAWEQGTETAIAEAMATVFKQLDAPKPKPDKKPKKK